MQVSHFSSGTLVGRVSPNPAVALVASIAAHFVLDKLPHFWPASTRGRWIFTVIDYVAALLMVGLLFTALKGNKVTAFWGFLGSAIVDILLVGVPSLRRSVVGRWHTDRQPHRTAIPALLTDAAVTALCLLLVFVL